MVNLVWAEDLDAAGIDRVRGLLLAAAAVDGRPEVAETGPLPGDFDGGSHLLAELDGTLVGYAHLDRSGDSFGRQVAELIVDPGYRGQGHGTELVKAVVAAAGDQPLRFWAHGDHPAAAHIAERDGFERARELLVLSVDVEDGAGTDWPEPQLPDGVSLRTFVPGQDEEAMIAVNARAFDWHPEQGSFTAAELRAAEKEDWFDADGFFLAERDGQVIGFHWTKVHAPNPQRFDGEPLEGQTTRSVSVEGGGGRRVGEVYVVGVDPDAQGGGLGKALTLAGLRYLREQGLRQIILYVEGDNAPAVAVYTKLGFGRFAVDVQYGR